MPGGDLRDSREYPLEAFRELIGNALVHRDLDAWSEGRAVEVRLTADRLIVVNPGGLYGISVERLGRVGTTSARNGRLVEICKYARAEDGARVVETLASGIPRIYDTLRADSLPDPDFYDAGISFTAVLRQRSPEELSPPGATRFTMTDTPLRGSEQVVWDALADGQMDVSQLERSPVCNPRRSGVPCAVWPPRAAPRPSVVGAGRRLTADFPDWVSALFGRHQDFDVGISRTYRVLSHPERPRDLARRRRSNHLREGEGATARTDGRDAMQRQGMPRLTRRHHVDLLRTASATC